MKILGTLSTGLILGLLICGLAQAEDDRSLDRRKSAKLQDLQMLGLSFSQYQGWRNVEPSRPDEPSGLTKLGRKVTGDVKKLGNGTKKLLSDTTAGAGKILHGAADVLTLKKPSPHKNASNPLLPWTWGAKEPPPANRWSRREPEKQKKSFMDFLIRREDPKPVESFDDWWELKRMDP